MEKGVNRDGFTFDRYCVLTNDSPVVMKGIPKELAPITERVSDCLRFLTYGAVNLMKASKLFDPRFPTRASLYEWFSRFVAYTNTHTVLCGVILIERVLNKLDTIQRVRQNVSSIPSLYLIGIMIASKSLDDNPLCNAAWVNVSSGYLSLQEINTAEIELLCFLDWRVHISGDEFDSLLEKISRII
eukprot:Rmarinus@m.20993